MILKIGLKRGSKTRVYLGLCNDSLFASLFADRGGLVPRG